MNAWARGLTPHSDTAAAAVFFLVLAVGSQERNKDKSEAWSKHARDLLLKHMCNNMNIATVQGFAILTIYMLRASQPNGAYLYFCKSVLLLFLASVEDLGTYLLYSTSSTHSLRDRYTPYRSQCLFRTIHQKYARSDMEKSARSRHVDQQYLRPTSVYIRRRLYGEIQRQRARNQRHRQHSRCVCSNLHDFRGSGRGSLFQKANLSADSRLRFPTTQRLGFQMASTAV